MSTTPPRDLASALFRKTRRLLLGWLFTHTDESFYVRELIRVTGAAPGAVSRELEELTAAGILRRTVRGNHVFYQADGTCPIFSELRTIFFKTVGLADQLREALKPHASRIVFAAVYGSAARGALRASSDVDLIVVGDKSFGEVVEALAPTQRQLGRDINPSVYSPAEFRSKIREGQHFLTSIVKEPLQFIVGGKSELERLGAKRLIDTASELRKGDRRPLRNRRARPER